MVINYFFSLFLAPSKPTFSVTSRGTTFFNISFDPTIMPVPGSLYYVQYKEDENGLYKANVSTTNKIIF